MGLFDYQCSRSGQVIEKIARADEETLPCRCGGVLTRKLTLQFHAHSDLKPYLDDHIGPEPQWVKSKQHRKQLMQQFGVSERIGKEWI